MGVLIDASILIEAERGRLDLEKKVTHRAAEAFFLSVVTASELIRGVHRAHDHDVRERRRLFSEALIVQFPLLDVDLAVARLHAEIWARLASEGQPIGSHDLWLGATCLAHHLAMATITSGSSNACPALSWKTGLLVSEFIPTFRFTAHRAP